MYVKTLNLTNVRSFPDLKIEFSKGINILTGVNNSGKSTIVKSIYKLQSNSALSSEDIRVTENVAKVIIHLDKISKQDVLAFSNSKHGLTNTSEGVDIHVDLRKEGQSRYLFQYGDEDSLPFMTEEGEIVHAFPTANFNGLPDSEDAINFIYPFFAKRKTAYYSMQGGKVNTFSVLDNFQNLPLKVLKASQSYAVKKKFEELCTELLGFTVATIPGENNEMRLGVFAGKNQMIPIESMGEGVVNIVGLITILLTENGKLFLIEELENDIHPAPLKKLLELIIEKSKNNQFIISTHSNIILKYLGAVPDSKIFCTEVKIGTQATENVSTSTVRVIGESIDERRQVLDLLGYDFFDFEMYSAYIIFEESSAERIVRDFILPTFFPKTYRKIRTIAAQGVNDVIPKFNDLNRLFMFLHTSGIYKDRVWVMVDGDSEGKKTIDRLNKTYSPTWGEDHFIQLKHDNFEKYYPKKFKKAVDGLNGLQTGEHKQSIKTVLLHEVLKWINEDKERAQGEFGESCKEIINHLKVIEAKIS